MKTENLRINCLYVFFFLLFSLIAFRIAYLQIFKKNFYRQLSENQHYRLLILEGRRGRIFDCQGRLLVTGLNCFSVFADPGLITDPNLAAEILAKELGLSEQTLRLKFKKKGRFVWIKRQVPWDKKEKINSFDLAGIGFIKEEKRFYPHGNVAASVLGVVGVDNHGLEGLELAYNDYLCGKQGLVRVSQDSLRKAIITPQIVTPQNGADLKLTMDSQIQYWVEVYLKETIDDFRADAGSVVVMNADSGEIIALANYPVFDPNDLNGVSPEQIRNRSISDMFEPGSVFKIVTLLAAIDSGKFSEETKLFCENGKFKIPGAYLHDWKPYGYLTFREVFKKSSNIGVAKIAHIIGKHAYYDYVKKLGFGSKTGVDLPGEINGLVRPVQEWSRTSEYNIPIGQGIGTNLLQLVCAFAVAANGGYLVEPYVVKNIIFSSFTKDTSVKKKQVVPPAVAQQAKSILIAAVEEGTGKEAGIKGVTIGGKTGTAQKFDLKIGRYSPSEYRASFIGFISNIENPVVIGVTIDGPKKHHFGGVVAAPLFRKVAQKIVEYMGLEGEQVQDAVGIPHES